MCREKRNNDGSLNSMLDELIEQLQKDATSKQQNRRKEVKRQSPADGRKPKRTSQKSKKFAQPVACKHCFKDYIYPKSLQNHKCSAVHGLSGILKTEPNKRTHQKTVKFAEDLEKFIPVPFRCPHCFLKFNHRRGFLHHRKNEKCITVQDQDQCQPEQSLSSRINALYSLYI